LLVVTLGVFAGLGGTQDVAPGQGSSTPQPPASAFGTYSGAKCPTPKPDGCVSGSAKDRVVVSHSKDGKTTASVRVLFEKGFSCSLKGEPQWVSDHFLLQADGLDADKPCKLELQVHKGSMQLRDQDGRCQQVYCGAGAAFDGAHFEKLPDKPRPQSVKPEAAQKSAPS
jgi:hypothetical protein